MRMVVISADEYEKLKNEKKKAKQKSNRINSASPATSQE